MQVQECIDMMLNRNIHQIINLPTRITNNTQTLIDHIYITGNLINK